MCESVKGADNETCGRLVCTRELQPRTRCRSASALACARRQPIVSTQTAHERILNCNRYLGPGFVGACVPRPPRKASRHSCVSSSCLMGNDCSVVLEPPCTWRRERTNPLGVLATGADKGSQCLSQVTCSLQAMFRCTSTLVKNCILLWQNVALPHPTCQLMPERG